MIEALGRVLHDAAPALLMLLVSSAFLLAIAMAAARLLYGASASVRHLVWASALCSLLVLPPASLFVPTIALRVLPVRTAPVVSFALETPATGVEPAAAGLVPDGASLGAGRDATTDVRPGSEKRALVSSSSPWRGGMVEADAPAWTWRSTVVAAWAIVALVLLVETARLRLRLRALAGGAWRVHDPACWRAAARIGAALGLRRPVLLLATLRTRVPLTWGTRSPIVLLPADAHRWPEERREAVLVHELAHVARGDALGHNVARLAAALYWGNPLVWLALRMMRSERERACDDLVLATGTRASSYATDLLEIARAMNGGTYQAAAALAMARPSELEGRLVAILDPGVPRGPATRRARIGAGLLALAVAVPLAALRPAERSVRQADEPARPMGAERVAAPAELRVMGPPAGMSRSERDAAGNESRSSSVRVPRIPPVVSPQTPSGEFDSAEHALRLGAMADIPSSPSFTIVEPLPVLSASGAAARQEPAERAGQGRGGDVETLIAVANAARGLSNDHDKAELLLAVLAHGVRNDSLQRVVLRSASTIGGSFHRHRVMIAMLRDTLIPGSEAEFLRAADGITSAHERGVVLQAFANAHSLENTGIRQAYLQAAVSTTSQHERTQLLARVIRRPEFDEAAAIDVLKAIPAVSSSHERANLLVALAGRGVTEDSAVRDAFLVAAASLQSASDYQRVMRAAGIGTASDRGRPRQ